MCLVVETDGSFLRDTVRVGLDRGLAPTFLLGTILCFAVFETSKSRKCIEPG